MYPWLLGTVVVALLSASGCQVEGEGSAGQPVVLELEAPAEVRVGETVPLKLLVTNASDRTVDLGLSGRPAYDFVVTLPDGTEVWRWLHEQAILEILAIVPLKPAEQREFSAEWTQRDNAGAAVPPGTYWIQSVLHTDWPQKLETEPKPLTIAP